MEAEHTIYPLEVKSGESQKKKSLFVYAEKYKADNLSRATLLNLKQDRQIYNYPLYLVSRLGKIKKEKRMKSHTLIKKPEITVVGIACRTSNYPNNQDIPLLWGRFFNERTIDKIPNKSSHDVFGLYCDYEGDYTKPYTLIIGCSVTSIEKIPEGMVVKTILSSSYARFEARGPHPKALIETWEDVWNTQLNRSYFFDFEVYGPAFSAKEPLVEVFIGVKQ